MDVLLQTAEESYLLGSDAWYGKLRDVVYALYEQKEIPLEMLIKAERRLGQLEICLLYTSTFLLRLGLVGEEYKNVRMHLLKDLPGDPAWRYDRSQYICLQNRRTEQREAR